MTADIHILGICGTFMGGIAAIARESGLAVAGSDRDVYPPMSTQLEALGISLMQGYSPAHLDPPPGEVVVGNAMSRGNPAVEHVLDQRLPYTSGPEWLARRVLHRRRVLAVAGTHGKTTTTALLAYLLDRQGRDPGFLIGGVPQDFPVSARLGGGEDFVIEADEYDTAFFDKRSKFVHYRPLVAILNNLEYDHADIFPDLAAIERQFHHLVRIVPGNGRLIVNGEGAALAEVLRMGCWTPVERFGLDAPDLDWRGELTAAVRRELSRRAAGEYFDRHARAEFNIPGITFGGRYDGSPAIVPDGTVPPPDGAHTYVPSACPGGRAPHVWLDDGRSLYDRLGLDWALLRLGPQATAIDGFVASARVRGIRLQVVDLPDAQARDLYGANLALLRPDRVVGWRGTDDSQAHAVFSRLLCQTD